MIIACNLSFRDEKYRLIKDSDALKGKYVLLNPAWFAPELVEFLVEDGFGAEQHALSVLNNGKVFGIHVCTGEHCYVRRGYSVRINTE